MAVINIKATIECEGCGKQFRIELDPASEPTNHHYPSWFDMVRGHLHGGSICEGLKGESIIGFSSVQSDVILCPPCTALVDDVVIEDRDATEDEIRRAVDAARAD